MMVMQLAEEEAKQQKGGAPAVAHSVKETRPTVTAARGFAASQQ